MGAPPAPRTSLVPTRVGGYDVLRRVASTERGDELAARDARGNLVAIHRIAAGATDGERESFLEQARARMQIQHAGLCRVIDAGTNDGRAYAVLEHVHGTTLAVLAERKVEAPIAAKIVMDAAEAIEAAPGVIDARDVRIGFDGAVKLARTFGPTADARAVVRSLGTMLREVIVNHGDPELESIARRCLDGELSSAGAVADALGAHLAKHGEVISARRIRARLEQLFTEEERAPRAAVSELSDDDLSIVPSSAAHAAEWTPDLPPGHPSNRPPWSASEPSVRPPRPARPQPRTDDRSPWIAVVFGVAAALAVAAFGYLLIRPHEEPRVPRREPAPATGTMILESEPSGATVFVDDREVGATPITVPNVPTGSRRVRFVLAGYTPHEGAVEVRANEPRVVMQPLVSIEGPRRFGLLTLTSDPIAAVYLDGERLGETPIRDVRVPAGVIRLELETRDGQRHTRGVVVRADDTTSTHIDLSARAP
jgi:hypothetical protein